MAYADKYDARRYSTYRFYRYIRSNAHVKAQIGRLYPNILDHVVLDGGDVNSELIKQVAQSPYVDDAVSSIHRFASRCLAADKSEMMVNVLSQVLMKYFTLLRPITDLLLFYGAKLDLNDSNHFYSACSRGMNDDVKQAIKNGRRVTEYDVLAAIESGSCDTIKLVHGAYGESHELKLMNLLNATSESMELCVSLNIMQHGKHYSFSNIPSFNVLHWILDHDVMKHNDIIKDIVVNASHYSGDYFDMLRYLIEQRNFTVPRDILIKLETWHLADLGVFDYLIWHGADVNAAYENGRGVLDRYPLLIRYWIDKGIAVDSNDANTLMRCIKEGMTAVVLEMMIDKYSMNVNDAGEEGVSLLHEACSCKRFEVVDTLIRHGADVNKICRGRTPYRVTSDDRIKQLLIQHGYAPRP